MDLEARPIWQTTLYFARWAEHAAVAPSLTEHLYELRGREDRLIASGVAPGAKSATGLFESRFNLFDSDHPALRKLKQFIGVALKTAVAHVNGNRVAPERYRVRAAESWFHITNAGGFHDAHQHHGCSWCGIYYLQAGSVEPPLEGGHARGGINRFYSPLGQGGIYRDAGNEYLRASNFDITPEDGLLVLFPSFLLHSALPYSGERDRIVISFNAQVETAVP